MTDEPTIAPPITPEIPFSESGSAHAPFLYFEEAPAFSALNGVIRITLEAVRVYNRKPGEVTLDRVGALLLANPAPTDTKN
jgi:hypothetical protein